MTGVMKVLYEANESFKDDERMVMMDYTVHVCIATQLERIADALEKIVEKR